MITSPSSPGWLVADWECIRSTAYIIDNNALTDTQVAAYTAAGFEVALQVDTGCNNWTQASLDSAYTTQLDALQALYPSLPLPLTERNRCGVWSDWASQPKVELAHGARLDTNYEYWPSEWVQDRPGMFTGSGMPMRFAGLDGSIIDVYQSVTLLTADSGQSYPATIDALLDNALGPLGYYGVFVANMQSDSPSSPGSEAIIASAQARDIPVTSARQLLEWLDGRNASRFTDLAWTGNTLTFNSGWHRHAAAGHVANASASGILKPFRPMIARCTSLL
jgi:hypothetical protein